MEDLRVGILGATGAVGQMLCARLENHPGFTVTYVAASPNSAGKRYEEAIAKKRVMGIRIPAVIMNETVGDANEPDQALGRCNFVFSAYESGKPTAAERERDIRETEMEYARLGIPVVSCNSAHRWTQDVPMIIPEINLEHMMAIDAQRKSRGFGKGFVVVKPNCSIQSFMIPVYALMRAGYTVESLDVVTQQGISGAGLPGVSAWHVIDNRLPHSDDEEEKTRKEPTKIFGTLQDGEIIPMGLNISAQCNRDPIVYGHTANVKLKFGSKKPSRLAEIIGIWEDFTPEIKRLGLYSAPNPVLYYQRGSDRPNPKDDLGAGNGMAITLGRLRECSTADIQFRGFSDNMIRGALGGAILTAELLAAKGYLVRD